MHGTWKRTRVFCVSICIFPTFPIQICLVEYAINASFWNTVASYLICLYLLCKLANNVFCCYTTLRTENLTSVWRKHSTGNNGNMAGTTCSVIDMEVERQFRSKKSLSCIMTTCYFTSIECRGNNLNYNGTLVQKPQLT